MRLAGITQKRVCFSPGGAVGLESLTKLSLCGTGIWDLHSTLRALRPLSRLRDLSFRRVLNQVFFLHIPGFWRQKSTRLATAVIITIHTIIIHIFNPLSLSLSLCVIYLVCVNIMHV
jgi:hypothetical protein